MPPALQSTFGRLRGILQPHAQTLSVTADTPTNYCLEANAGPATVKAWGGKLRKATIPVAWVDIGKTYVS